MLIVRIDQPGRRADDRRLLQISRLFGGEIGTAFMQTFVRVREQIHSNLIGLHVDRLATSTIDRLAAYRRAIGRAHRRRRRPPPGREAAGGAVAQQAAVLSYIDGFLAAAAGRFVCLLLTALIRRRRFRGMSRPRVRFAGGEEAYRRVTSFLLRITKGIASPKRLWRAES